MQIELKCGHIKRIVEAWCEDYCKTEIRCPPNIVHWEYRVDSVCRGCRPPKPLPPQWEAMIRRDRTSLRLRQGEGGMAHNDRLVEEA
ncbi:hypothetical protein SAPIO_CDS9432 [Scedosporium apiospermum]|uniref:Uncharacterized protein n=1 Tax=Pseudallescheria apiosperma TaxID=563466 RepID=A0A084FWT1_PSEDA|nr:uncharacterized protein SAPIO_CDS9432 [Scedosporium apiospermum]KEZ39543.1 hypothetical protein SAPIO_CDS9432 [Scedosporium apiospermum]